MIDVKQAVKIALDYLRLLYNNDQLHDVLLEEVILSDDEGYWYVTLGFSRPIPSTNPLLAATESLLKTTSFVDNREFQREYKVFQIDSDTGQVRAMKMRAA
jgi:hypothetical protein